MIRSILFNVFYWIPFGLALIATYPVEYFLNRKSTYKYVYRVYAYWLLFCLRVFANVGRKTSGIGILKEALKSGPVIIGCNHQSVWETLIFATLFDELSIVIKKELLQIPVAGLYFRRLGCIPIDRSSGIKAIKSLITFGKRSIDERVSILIFPNGTRSSANEETEFKGGIYAMYKAFSVPVILVKIDSGKCWPRRSFRKYPGIINMEFKPPIAPGLSKEAFMEKIAENL